jgi:DNA-binding transcriptional regulator YdaS (Cro superfamily)
MTKSTNAINTWMRQATVAEQVHLANLVGTTRGNLYQYASGNRTPSSERAIKIEAATQELARMTKGRLPVLYRTDMSPACASCHFAQKCLGTKSEFQPL